VYCGPNCKCIDCHNIAGSEVSCPDLSSSLTTAQARSNKSAMKLAVQNKRSTTTSKVELSDSEGDHTSNRVSLPSSWSSSPCMSSDEIGPISATPFKVRSKRFTTAIATSSADFGPAIVLPEMNLGHLIKSTQRTNLRERSPSFDAATSLSCRPPKKSRLVLASQEKDQEPIYQFFGPNLPPTTKLIALSCLEYLDGPSLYSMSCVNHLWSQAAMDDALWE
jgi:hypothetical protein